MNNYTTLVDLIIKDELRGIPRHEAIISLGKTPTCLIEKANFNNHELIMKGKTLTKICFDHGIRTSQIKQLPKMIASPKGIYTPADPKHKNSVVVLTFEFHRGDPFIISIRKNQSIGRNQVYNELTSAYGKEGGNPEARWKRQNLLIWEPNGTP